MDWRASSFKETKQAKQVVQTIPVSLDKKAAGNLLGADKYGTQNSKVKCLENVMTLCIGSLRPGFAWRMQVAFTSSHGSDGLVADLANNNY